MGLTTEERVLINTEIEARGKKAVVAYLLAIFLGMLGAHRFYLGKVGTGVTQLVLTILGYATLVILIGGVFLFGVAAWVLVDLFLIPGIIREDYNRIEREVFMSLQRENSKKETKEEQ